MPQECVTARWWRYPAGEGRSIIAIPSSEGIADARSSAQTQAVTVLPGTVSARQAVGRIQRLSRESTADSGFLAELSQQLHEIVPFDASFWAGADPMTTLATSPSRLENVYSDDSCERYWESEFL